MGTLWWKTIRRKPFTSTELHQSADLLLKQPPLPADWRNAAIDVRARDGTTLLDTWRAHFTSELKAIATKETWTLQKAACVSFVFMENSWRTTTIVAHKAKSPSSWKHILGDNKLFEGAEGQNLLALLTQRYLMAILSATCLTTIAHRLYSLNDQEMSYIEWWLDFEQEIKLLDVATSDLVSALIDQYRDDDAINLADHKDDEINPFLQKNYSALADFQGQIQFGTFEMSRAKSIAASFDDTKLSIVGRLKLLSANL